MDFDALINCFRIVYLEFCGRTLDSNDSNNGSDSNDSTGSTNSPDDATSAALSFLLLATIIF